MNKDDKTLLEQLQEDFSRIMNMSDDEFDSLMADYYFAFLNPEE